MRKLLGTFILLFLLNISTVSVALGDTAKFIITPGSHSYIVSDKTFDLQNPPLVEDGHVYIPLKDVVISQNGSVSWDQATNTATAVINWQTRRYSLVATAGDTNVQVINGPGAGLSAQFVTKQELSLRQPCILVDGHLYVPLGALGQALGYNVQWNPSSNSVEIY